MNISRVEAFEAGMQFAISMNLCWDSRDISRALGGDQFPPGIQDLAPTMNGFESKRNGIVEAKRLITDFLRMEDGKDGA